MNETEIVEAVTTRLCGKFYVGQRVRIRTNADRLGLLFSYDGKLATILPRGTDDFPEAFFLDIDGVGREVWAAHWLEPV